MQTTLGWEASWPIRVSGSLPAAWTEKQFMSGFARKIRSGMIGTRSILSARSGWKIRAAGGQDEFGDLVVW